ncbi:hypothetical protein ACJRO7_027850 [Eucalyptus globulus]|uniref:Uncharacterized protein n=1 Tax=Eucalyptus globulus TaxID=34317 RepID=A0ABD3K5D8_EUCGL
MAWDLEPACQVLFWLERVAFFGAYTLAVAAFPATWRLGIALSLAFQFMSFWRAVIQSENPGSKRESKILYMTEHAAAILLDVYLKSGQPPPLTMALLLFEASCAIRLLRAGWAKHSGEVAKVFWAKIFDEETEKTEDGNSVAKPVESKVEQEGARLESPEKEAVEGAGLEEKTSKGHVDKLEETVNWAALCEANDEQMLDTSQAMSGSRSPGEPPLVQPQESRAGDESRPSKKPKHECVPPPAPSVGMYREYLQIMGEEDCCSLGRGYYTSPWARERDYLVEELDKAKGAVNMYQQLADGYSKDIHQLTMKRLELASKLEDLTARNDIVWAERELLRKSFKALLDCTFNLARRTCNEALCAEYYKQCCLEYSEGKGLLQEENARLEAEVEELRKRLNESECKRQALEENARLLAETEELRKQLDEAECKRQALEEEKASLDTNLSGAIALCEVYCFVLKYISLFNRVNT